MIVANYPPLKPLRIGPLAVASNAHVQTIGALMLPGPKSRRQSVKQAVHLSDGDRLVIHDDQPKNWITGDRIAILVHGLCGCHGSPYIHRTARKLRRQGIRTIRVDLRGSGDSTLISRGHQHAGCSQDLRDIVSFVHQLSPLSKFSLVAFSLGANILLKTLGEWSDKHPKYVDSAIAVSPPIDLSYCSANLRQFGNRIYEFFFMSRLGAVLALRRRKILDLVDNGLNPIPDRLVHFDDQFVAPVSGFSGAREYYEKCSSAPRLSQIAVPTVIVAAKDDPLIPFDMYISWPMSHCIELVSTRYGGHLGFLGSHSGDSDRHWLDWRICHWIDRLDDVG